MEQHMEHLKKVFKKLKDVDLQLNREKCSFLHSCVKYLGFYIGNGKIYPDPERVKAIHEMPYPRDKTSLRSFIGTLNQFKDFIPHLRGIIKPLDTMTSQKKEVKFEWTDEAKNAFEEARKILCSDAFLVIYDPSKKHYLECDASDYALAGVLKQEEFENGKRVERVVEYHSRAFNSAERNYTCTEKELLAIIDSLRHWRPYLVFDKFVVRSDHHAICQASRLGQTSKTIPDHARLSRWSWELQNFQCSVEYIKGKNHIVADCLSRNVFPKIDLRDLIDQEVALTGKNPMSNYSVNLMSVYQPVSTFFYQMCDARLDKLRNLQEKDIFCKSLIDDLCSNPKKAKKLGKKIKSRFIMVQGVLCNQFEKRVRKSTSSNGPPTYDQLRKKLTELENPSEEQLDTIKRIDKENEFTIQTITRIVVPESYVWQVLKLCHDTPTSGHFGQDSTLERAKLQFYWPNMKWDIHDYVMSCDVCQRRNPKNTRDGLQQAQSLDIPEEVIEPFSILIMDQIEIPSVKLRGHKYILLAMDMTSKFMFTRAVTSLSAKNVIKFINEQILQVAKPIKFVSDNGQWNLKLNDIWKS